MHWLVNHHLSRLLTQPEHSRQIYHKGLSTTQKPQRCTSATVFTQSSQVSLVMASHLKHGYTSITVASLCCDVNDPTSMTTEPTKADDASGSRSLLVPKAVPILAQPPYSERCYAAPTLGPIPCSHTECLHLWDCSTQFDSVELSDRADDFRGTYDSGSDEIGSTGMAMDTRTITEHSKQHRNSISSAAHFASKAFCHHKADFQVSLGARLTPIDLQKHIPLLEVFGYTQAQKIFIMYYRVVVELSWQEIMDKFERAYGARPKDSLRRVYYRTREEWGLGKVRKAQSYSSGPDRKATD